MPKGGARRRKRRSENETATTKVCNKDTVNGDASNGGKPVSSKNIRFIMMAIAAAAAVVVVAILFRGNSSDPLLSGGAEGNDKVTDASRRNQQQQSQQTTTTTTPRDTSMDGPDYKVLEVLPHDTSAFTQGLTYLNGYLYESTGYHGQSQIRRIDPTTGEVLASLNVDSNYFGEGLAHFVDGNGVDCLIHLTWQEETGFIYRASDFEILKTFSFTTFKREGWGITFDPINKEFIVSDGSQYLHVWDSETLQETRRIAVQMPQPTADGTFLQPIPYLNELEWYDKDTILANVWYTDVIVRINTSNGNVEKVYRFDNLYKERIAKADCFNGVAVTDTPRIVYVTGKWWPHLYKIQLLE